MFAQRVFRPRSSRCRGLCTVGPRSAAAAGIVPFALCLATQACVGHIGDSDPLKGGGAVGQSSSELCIAGHPTVAGAPLRRLTRTQYRNSVKDLLGVDVAADAVLPDEKVAAFFSNAVSPVSELGVEKYMNVAEQVASAAQLSTLVPCDAMSSDVDACVSHFI